jgi:hypothetical protein
VQVPHVLWHAFSGSQHHSRLPTCRHTSGIKSSLSLHDDSDEKRKKKDLKKERREKKVMPDSMLAGLPAPTHHSLNHSTPDF